MYDAFSDPELRYRQRYVDLIVNPQVRQVFLQRTKIIDTMRRFFNERGYVEVETPILQSIPGGASARRSSRITMRSTFRSTCGSPTSYTSRS